MDSLRRLEEIFARFPGIGPRQAKRFVYYLLNKSPASIKEFADLVQEVKRSTTECDRCHRFFADPSSARGAGQAICGICADETRDDSLLMIVARDSDFETVEKSGVYKGLYFILGGTIPILDAEPEKRIRLTALTARMSEPNSPISEVILSMNATPEGENTADLLKERLKSHKAKITILGRGLSTGAELEYVDADTIKNALDNRK